VPPTLPLLAPDRLQLLVFGPGTGELVLVRAPPGDWLVLDGCATHGVKSYALAVLSHYHQQDNVRFIALTHPHEDHAGGIAELVDALLQPASLPGWPRLGMIWPSPPGEPVGGDEQDQFRGARVRQALAAILDRWERKPSCRWDLLRGDTRTLGEATLRVLSPAPAARADSWRLSPPARWRPLTGTRSRRRSR
jgi:glyoxylase-like metal-dependent hydrolase (beta-lactamase superfamily II)